MPRLLGIPGSQGAGIDIEGVVRDPSGIPVPAGPLLVLQQQGPRKISRGSQVRVPISADVFPGHRKEPAGR